MFLEYSLDVSRIFKWAEKEMFSLHHPYVGTEHLLLSLLKNDKNSIDILEKYNVDYDKFKNELLLLIGSANKKSIYVLWTPLLKQVVNNATLKAGGANMLRPVDLLTSLIEEDDGIALRVLEEMDVDLDGILDELQSKKNDKYLELYSIGKNLQETVNMEEKVVGRDQEIIKMIEILIRKNKNNPLLLGEAGVGKTAIVEELARRINRNEVPMVMRNKKIVMLEMSSLVAGTKYRGEFEERLNRIIKEIENNTEIILFIDEIHTMVNAGGAEGAISAGDILKPYMARGSIKIIGATTPNEYSKYILKDKALARRLEIVNINEPGYNATFNILNNIKDSYEKFYNIIITEDNIKTIIEGTNKYIKNKFNPDKSIAILDLLCAKKNMNAYEMKNELLTNELNVIKNKKEKMVQINDFNKAIELYKTEKDLESQLKKAEFLTIDNLEIIDFIKDYCNIHTISNDSFIRCEKMIKQDIIGQDAALSELFNKLKQNNIPSFLLKGSIGVGKKETVILLSKYLEIPLIRLNMAEYMDDTSINKLIGVSSGYVGYDDECIFDKIKNNPSSVLLIENIDDANIRIVNLINKILEERVINNNKGEKIDFSYTYIFITSNIKDNNSIGFLEHNIDNDTSLKTDYIINYKSIDLKILKEYLKKKGIKNTSLIKNYNYHKMGLKGINNFLKI